MSGAVITTGSNNYRVGPDYRDPRDVELERLNAVLAKVRGHSKAVRLIVEAGEEEIGRSATADRT